MDDTKAARTVAAMCRRKPFTKKLPSAGPWCAKNAARQDFRLLFADAPSKWMTFLPKKDR